MRPCICGAIAAAIVASPAFAQSDACRGALSALNRVKEQITPDLSAQTPSGRDRLQTMLSALETSTRVCKDVPELWYYRMLVSERLGRKDSYSESKLQEFAYQPKYDPFSLPPSATPPAPEEAVSKIRKKWALVVGIDRFQDNRVPGLRYAVKDSSDFTDFLTNPDGGRFQAERVRHVVNDDATLQGIREGLGWLRENVQRDDLVVLYFSSHGSPREIDPNGVSYIITHDTNLDNAAKLYATSLQMIDLVQALNREIKARRVVLILDTCYSGDASGARAIRPVWSVAPPPADSPASSSFSAALQNLKVGVGRAVIAATRANEQSWESESLMNGYFTHFLIGALSEEHGIDTLGTIFPKVRDQVSAGVRHQYGETQTPSCEFSDHASDIVIGAPEGG